VIPLSSEEILVNMLNLTTTSIAASTLIALASLACGDPPAPKAPIDAPTVPQATASVAPSVTAVATTAPVTSTPAPVEQPAPRQKIEETAISSFERSTESLKIDKVGVADGALTPDGQKDVVLTLKLTGPFESVYVASVDAKTGATTGEFQADTLTGTVIQPNEFAAMRSGARTVGVGVFEGDKLLNNPDGSLPPIAGGAHTLTLVLANSASLKVGKPIAVFIQTTDHQVVKGPILLK
jgi:hypothetical protein